MTGIALRQNAVVKALAAGGCHPTSELALVTGIRRGEVAGTLSRLVSRRYVARLSRGCFELTDEGRAAYDAGETICSGPRGPLTQSEPRRRRKETERDRIWAAIRILQKFGLATLEEITCSNRTAIKRYVNDLERAGYLVQLRPEQPPASGGIGRRRWSLVDDTGFEAPSIIFRAGTRVVYDRNTSTARPLS